MASDDVEEGAEAVGTPPLRGSSEPISSAAMKQAAIAIAVRTCTSQCDLGRGPYHMRWRRRIGIGNTALRRIAKRILPALRFEKRQRQSGTPARLAIEAGEHRPPLHFGQLAIDQAVETSIVIQAKLFHGPYRVANRRPQ